MFQKNITRLLPLALLLVLRTRNNRWQQTREILIRTMLIYNLDVLHQYSDAKTKDNQIEVCINTIIHMNIAMHLYVYLPTTQQISQHIKFE